MDNVVNQCFTFCYENNPSYFFSYFRGVLNLNRTCSMSIEVNTSQKMMMEKKYSFLLNGRYFNAYGLCGITNIPVPLWVIILITALDTTAVFWQIASLCNFLKGLTNAVLILQESNEPLKTTQQLNKQNPLSQCNCLVVILTNCPWILDFHFWHIPDMTSNTSQSPSQWHIVWKRATLVSWQKRSGRLLQSNCPCMLMVGLMLGGGGRGAVEERVEKQRSWWVVLTSRVTMSLCLTTSVRRVVTCAGAWKVFGCCHGCRQWQR